ncbi:GNAT family N-acetyltransferase [Microvirga rosea]|uniref:GNAT family N-acetyltransferase n=1 Tax=Microvirga rosea TaxID=2715425 RepID=UPI001D0A5410|nr:GNAT family N-acetyltransferase [Microvirga rosea]MCB8822619.1 GNAT family N-acetyltransferase [Microvirga rosea]
MNSVVVRRLSPDEWPAAYPIIAQLRNLQEDVFIERVRRQTYSGYELVGAFDDGRLIGVMGMRPVHTLARGSHLHVDDLVVDTSCRTTGAGRSLMTFAEKEARSRGMSSVFLDARKDAIPFYERIGFEFHPAPSMKKILA